MRKDETRLWAAITLLRSIRNRRALARHPLVAEVSRRHTELADRLPDIVASLLDELSMESEMAGAIVSEQFLDGGGDQRKIVAQHLKRDGIAQKGENSVADQVRGGFLAAHHGDDAIRYDLPLGERVALNLRREQ